jgi:peptide/nickel transport system substrate-binding protein
MMFRALLAMLMLVCVGLTACSSAPSPQTVVQTVVVRETVVVEAAGATDVPVQPTPASSVVEPTIEQTFIIAVGSDPGPLNPHDYASSFIALDMVYEPLVRYAADGSIVPGLAESWQIAPDGLTWTFTLRKGVTFHDGTPFNAAAVKWNFERWVQTERHNWLPSTTRIESVSTTDDYTVVLKMKDFYYATIQDLALIRPVRFLSPASVGSDGSFGSPVGTGPWKLDDYTAQQRASFVPNPSYWGEKPTLSKVVFEVIPDAQTRIAALLSNEVDLIGGEYVGGISLESLPVLQRNPNVQIFTEPGTTGYFLQMNFNEAPFNDINVRKALNHAIDRETISSGLFGSIAAPAQGVFPESVPYVTYTGSELYRYDPTLAKKLLADAGYASGADGMLAKDGKPLELSLVVDSAMFPQAGAMAQVLQAQLKEVGIALKPRLLDYSGWIDAYSNKEYDLLMNITWGAPYDPHSSLTGVFSSASSATIAYSDPELDQLITSAMATRDEAERTQVFEQIWTRLDEQAAIAPLAYSSRVYAVRKGVEGFVMAGTEYELNLQGIRISER